jgi:cold-inducible RNA-binding protein
VRKIIIDSYDIIYAHFRKDEFPPSSSLEGGILFPKGEKMEAKVYVGNLSYDTTEDELRDLFAQAGTVTTVELIRDRDTGNSKGFAFVTMDSMDDANKAIQQINGQSFGNRELKVSMARPREERSGGYDSNRSGGYRGNQSRDRRSSGGGNRRY